MEKEARIAGYTAHILLPDGTHSDVDVQDAYEAFLNQSKLKPSAALWQAFEHGWDDAHESTTPITVSQAAKLAGVGARYIRDEIEAGRLTAERRGRQFEITPANFDIWMSNPKRGSRVKAAMEYADELTDKGRNDPAVENDK